MPAPVMVVAPAGQQPDLPAHLGSYCLDYRCIEHTPADGLSAWRAQRHDAGELIEVAADCEGLVGGYRQHALNRFFSQALLRQRPTVVVIVGLNGFTADLPRVAALLGVPVIMLPGTVPELQDLSAAVLTWLRASLGACDRLLLAPGVADQWPEGWIAPGLVADEENLGAVLQAPVASDSPALSYDYSLYEFCQRDHPLLAGMQQRDTRHFSDCERVLDLACGSGIFLDCLRTDGIGAFGVERDERIAEYARGMGLDVRTEDALSFLRGPAEHCDGIYCSHFIEHLPVEAVQQLLQLLAATLPESGVLVLVFPDPESIRSQLLGFWRDPEHVRFYHPELVTAMAAAAGLELEWSSYDEQPHRVVSFEEDPPPMPELGAGPGSAEAGIAPESPGLLDKLLGVFGVASTKRIRSLEARLEHLAEVQDREAQRLRQASGALEARTAVLWDISRTWAWNDNVTLKFRKGQGSADSV